MYSLNQAYLPPTTKLRQGNVFTRNCGSVHRGGGLCQGDPLWTETPLDRDPPGQRPPWTETPWTETP